MERINMSNSIFSEEQIARGWRTRKDKDLLTLFKGELPIFTLVAAAVTPEVIQDAIATYEGNIHMCREWGGNRFTA